MASSDKKQRKPGRPRKYVQPRREVHISLPDDLLDALDRLTDNRTAYIEQVLRKHLEEVSSGTHEH